MGKLPHECLGEWPTVSRAEVSADAVDLAVDAASQEVFVVELMVEHGKQRPVFPLTLRREQLFLQGRVPEAQSEHSGAVASMTGSAQRGLAQVEVLSGS